MNLPCGLKLVLEEAVKVVNFIKSRPSKLRIIKALCDEMISSHSALLFHTEVRWLSRVKVLTSLFRAQVRDTSFFFF